MRTLITLKDEEGAPIRGATVQGILPILPLQVTSDERGFAYFITPTFITPLTYLMHVSITVNERVFTIGPLIGFGEEEAFQVTVGEDIKVRQVPTTENILGEEWDEASTIPITKEDLVTGDFPNKILNNCATCKYLFPALPPDPPGILCIVNGADGVGDIRIEDPPNTICKIYSPIFILPSPQKIARDIPRQINRVRTKLFQVAALKE